MKKLIPLILITSLLLSACSFNGSNKEDLFEKKQECYNYGKQIMNENKWSNHSLDETFYSPKKRDCYFIIRYNGETIVTKQLYRFFENKVISMYELKSCGDDEICTKAQKKVYDLFDRTVEDLKGE